MKELTSTNFEAETSEASGLVVVDFWAPWCGPCKAFMPTLEELANELEGSVTFAKVNVDESASLTSAEGIRAVPTIQVYKDGEKVSQFTGGLTKEKILELIDSCRD